MNRCALCGKFCSWADLKFRWSVHMDGIDGGVIEDEWFECDKCTDWKQVPA
jgi:hypothetical protein